MLERNAEILLGEMRWTNHFDRMIAKGYASTTASLVADDEMQRSNWIRMPDGWVRAVPTYHSDALGAVTIPEEDR